MKKILIIENDKKQALVFKDYLEMNDYEVVISLDGEEGLNMALDDDIDIVLLETDISGNDGYVICKMLRQKRQIPVMFVSRSMDEAQIVRAFGIGADDYLVKPVKMGEMLARVKRHLARYETFVGIRESKRNIIEIRNLTIDKTSRRVFLAGKEKYFTTKEYDLLEYLVSNPNKVFSKEELFKSIWNNEVAGDISTVIVHIKKVREKLGDKTGKNKYIDTVWGIGYRFID